MSCVHFLKKIKVQIPSAQLKMIHRKPDFEKFPNVYFLFALTFSSVCRTGLLHSEFWALLNKSPWQRAALQPRGGNLHQHHSVWTGQPGAAGQGPVQDGELFTFIQSFYPHCDNNFYSLPSILIRLRRRPVEIAWWGIWPSFDCRSFYLFDLVLKGFFPKTADSHVILLTTSCKEIYFLIYHKSCFIQPSVWSSFGSIFFTSWNISMHLFLFPAWLFSLVFGWQRVEQDFPRIVLFVYGIIVCAGRFKWNLRINCKFSCILHTCFAANY